MHIDDIKEEFFNAKPGIANNNNNVSGIIGQRSSNNNKNTSNNKDNRSNNKDNTNNNNNTSNNNNIASNNNNITSNNKNKSDNLLINHNHNSIGIRLIDK